MTPDKLINILTRVAHKDPTVADDLDAMADDLHNLATRIRNSNEGTRSQGGMDDRVQMSVVGPDGNIKHRVDTKS